MATLFTFFVRCNIFLLEAKTLLSWEFCEMPDDKSLMHRSRLIEPYRIRFLVECPQHLIPTVIAKIGQVWGRRSGNLALKTYH